MSLHSDLLEQALDLAQRDRRRPKQASLRRAISTAYYALFHLLISEASRLFVRDERLVNSINRVYGHAEMNKISKAFAAGEWPRRFDPIKGSLRLSQELKNIAKAFVELQEARHDADYDLGKKFTRSDAVSFVDKVKKAFAEWEMVRNDDLTKVYLASFLLWEKWDKTR